MKKVLIVATVYKFLNFEKNDIQILKDLGYEVHCATNMHQDDWLKDDGSMDNLGMVKHQIDFGRTPFNKQSIVAYKQLKKLINKYDFDLIHCHTPVAAAITRFAAVRKRKQGTYVIYTSHGFHFHKKSSWKNWFLYYPIEYVLAFFTDMIITINREDYKVIQRFPVEEKRYIPGVGVDISAIRDLQVDKGKIRENFGIPENAFLILSIGELSVRKNHGVILRAVAGLKDPNVYYIICGTGDKLEEYKQQAIDSGIEQQVIFAGQQPHNAVLELCHACDIGALPSRIEGLGLAGIETMAAGKPVIASDVHGIRDYVIEGETGYTCAVDDVNGYMKAIKKLINNRDIYEKCAKNAQKIAWKFDISESEKAMKENYKRVESEER